MKHRSIQNKLLLYLDGSLKENDKRKVEKHLPQCPHCKNQLAMLSVLWKKETAVGKYIPSPFLWTKIENRINSNAEQNYLEHFGFNKLPYILRFSATVLIIVISFFIGNYLGSIPQSISKQNSEFNSKQYIVQNYHLDSFQLFPDESIGQAIILTSDQKK
ncbi:MAG: zf-HC2 domain-containing protein [Ignavibacteriales bacterium]|nr:zf-HC2 domain-containing protein [Ignavibacteriales bacterium]